MSFLVNAVEKKEGRYRVVLVWNPDSPGSLDSEKVKERFAGALQVSTYPLFRGRAHVSSQFGGRGGSTHQFDDPDAKRSWKFMANALGEALASASESIRFAEQKVIDGNHLESTLRTLADELQRITRALSSHDSGEVVLTLHEVDGCRVQPHAKNPSGPYDSAKLPFQIKVSDGNWDKVTEQCLQAARDAFETSNG